MPRKIRQFRKPAQSDPIYNSELLNHFINKILKKGKKVKAQGIVYGALKLIDEKGAKPGIEVFQQAVEKCRPLVEVKPRRVGGATLQVPVEVESRRGINLSMEWIVDGAKKRAGKSMIEKIAYEMIDAVSETGAAFKKKSDVHRMAEANKSYSHYRW